MATTVFPAPPPTTNAHTPNSRTRFARSARKFSMIWGTTPVAVDAVPAVPALPSTTKSSADHYSGHKRHASIFAMRPKSTVSGEAASPSSMWTYQWHPSTESDYEGNILSRSSEESTRSLPTRLHSSASLVHIPLLATSDVSDSDSSSSSPVSRKGGVFRRRRACPPPLHLHVCLPQPKQPTPHRSYFSPDTAVQPVRGNCVSAESDEEEDRTSYPRDPLRSPLSPPLTTASAWSERSAGDEKFSDASPLLSPFTPVTSVAVIRARKMTKVTQILGEAVSPTLLFGRRSSKIASARRGSVGSLLSPVAAAPEAPRPQQQQQQQYPFRGYRPPVTQARVAGPPSPRPFAERRRSASVSMVSEVSGVSWLMVTPPGVKMADAEHLPERSCSPDVRREEAGWTGSWNAKNMDQVRGQLRLLKESGGRKRRL